MSELLPFTTSKRLDENVPNYSPELASRFSDLTHVIVHPSGMDHPFEADDIAAALCELITYFVYQPDMTERENMQWAVLASAFERTAAKDGALEAFTKRRLVLSEEPPKRKRALSKPRS